MNIATLFNVRREELARVSVCFSIQFLLRLSILFGWTFLVGILVSRQGASSLPMLFLVDGAFILFGSILLSIILPRSHEISLIVKYAFVALALLTVSLFFLDRNPLMFFASLLFTISFVLTQAQILLAGVMEKLFTPEQAERVFPVIDSADTIGGLFAGAMLFTFSSVLSSRDLILLWIAISALLACVTLVLRARIARETHIEHEKKSTHLFKKLRALAEKKEKTSFLMSLLLVVFCQWLFVMLLDFLYTVSVYEHVGQNVFPDGASGMEHAMVHELGVLQMVFSLSALAMQFFFVSRIQQWLGVVGSMFLYPILGIMSLFSMVFRPGLLTAALGRNNADMTNTLYKNAYHATYYLFPHAFARTLRPILEGMIRPLGSIAATSLLFIGQYVFSEQTLMVAVKAAILAALLISLIALMRAARGYTAQATDQLLSAETPDMQLQALEILAQKGHSNVDAALEQFMQKKWSTLSKEIKQKVVRLFMNLEPAASVRLYLRCYRDPEIQTYAAETMYLALHKHRRSKLPLFTRHHFINELMASFGTLHETADGFHLRILAHISPRDAVKLILRILRAGSSQEKLHALSALGAFHDENIVSLVKPFLAHEDFKVRAQAWRALKKYPSAQTELKTYLEKWSVSEDTEEQKLALTMKNLAPEIAP